MKEFFDSLPPELTETEKVFVDRVKKIKGKVVPDMLAWAVYHIDWKIPYPGFPEFDPSSVPEGTDPAIHALAWNKEEKELKAKLWRRMFKDDEDLIACGPIFEKGAV